LYLRLKLNTPNWNTPPHPKPSPTGYDSGFLSTRWRAGALPKGCAWGCLGIVVTSSSLEVTYDKTPSNLTPGRKKNRAIFFPLKTNISPEK